MLSYQKGGGAEAHEGLVVEGVGVALIKIFGIARCAETKDFFFAVAVGT